MNEALVLGAVRQHELTEAADRANAQLKLEISERKLAEEALRASEERFRSLFAAAPMAVFVCDRHGVIQLYNQRAEELWGRAPVCGVEQHCGSMKLWLPDGAFLPHLQSPIVAVLRTGIPVHNVEVLIERPDGTRLPVLVNFAALKNQTGEITGAITSFLDITERKLAEEALHQAQTQLAEHAGQLEALVTARTAELTATNQQMEAFVYSIAHDLRAPLRSMQGFATLLVAEAGAALSATGQDYAARINKSARFMDAMLLDLLHFSRISQQRVELTAVNLETVVASVLTRLQPDIQEKQARVESAGPWPVVRAHEPTLTQVLFNLVNNALKFVAPGVPPVVRLWAEEKAVKAESRKPGEGASALDSGPSTLDRRVVRVWVEDNGPGIAPDHQAQIFRLFIRLDGDKYAGTGIGLAIVQKGIERMGGSVGVESAAGHGSRFWFQLRSAANL